MRALLPLSGRVIILRPCTMFMGLLCTRTKGGLFPSCKHAEYVYMTQNQLRVRHIPRSEPCCRAQVLMATHLKRTESVIQPALFRFDEHFELQDLIGASRNSEVLLVTALDTALHCV